MKGFRQRATRAVAGKLGRAVCCPRAEALLVHLQQRPNSQEVLTVLSLAAAGLGEPPPTAIRKDTSSHHK